MRRRTEITIETERVVVLEGGGRDDETRWCEMCGAKSHLISPDAAAALLGVTAQAILRWAEAGGLHFAEAVDTAPLLCLNSLPRDGKHDTQAVEMKTEDGESFQPEF